MPKKTVILLTCCVFCNVKNHVGKNSNLILEENIDSTMFKLCSLLSLNIVESIFSSKINVLTQFRKGSRVKVVNINKKC